MTKRTWTDLPGFVLRALHSGWTDWLLAAPSEVAEAMAERCCGLSFQRFALALSAQRLTVTQRLTDQGELLIGIAVPTSDGKPWHLFELTPGHTGMTFDFLATLSMHRIDESFTKMIEGEM